MCVALNHPYEVTWYNSHRKPTEPVIAMPRDEDGGGGEDKVSQGGEGAGIHCTFQGLALVLNSSELPSPTA